VYTIARVALADWRNLRVSCYLCWQPAAHGRNRAGDLGHPDRDSGLVDGVDCEDSLSYADCDTIFAADGTGETRRNVLERMWEVNGVVGKMVVKLLKNR